MRKFLRFAIAYVYLMSQLVHPVYGAASDITDYGSGSNVITEVGTPTSQNTTTKVWDYCYDFPGTTDYLSVNGLVSTLASDTAGTVAMWVYFDGDSGALEFMTAAADTGSTTNTLFQINPNFSDDKLRCNIFVDGTIQWDWETADNWLDDKLGAWHHFMLVQNGTSPVFYWDGADITTTGGNAFTVTTDQTKWLKAIYTDATTKSDNYIIGGRNRNGVIIDLDGKLDDYRIWSNAKTSGDATTLFGGGPGTTASIDDDEVFWMHSEPGASGWTHTINGVTAANMTSVNGVLKANISTINNT